jgi:hypothetical protein
VEEASEHVILSEAKDPLFVFNENQQMLRSAQHDRMEFFHSLLD